MPSAVILAKRRSVYCCAGSVTAWGPRVRGLRGRTESCPDSSNGQHSALVLKQGQLGLKVDLFGSYQIKWACVRWPQLAC